VGQIEIFSPHVTRRFKGDVSLHARSAPAFVLFLLAVV
jgi:hypothetical protein